MAGMEGVEPPLTEPESAVLPLDDIPMTASLRSAVPLRKKEIYGKSRRDASPNFDFFEIQSNWPNFSPTREGPVKPTAVHEGQNAASGSRQPLADSTVKTIAPGSTIEVSMIA